MTHIAVTPFEKDSNNLLRKLRTGKKELVLAKRGKAFEMMILINVKFKEQYYYDLYI